MRDIMKEVLGPRHRKSAAANLYVLFGKDRHGAVRRIAWHVRARLRRQ